MSFWLLLHPLMPFGRRQSHRNSTTHTAPSGHLSQCCVSTECRADSLFCSNTVIFNSGYFLSKTRDLPCQGIKPICIMLRVDVGSLLSQRKQHCLNTSLKVVYARNEHTKRVKSEICCGKKISVVQSTEDIGNHDETEKDSFHIKLSN